MNRVLLALIALLTGLAAQSAPVAARVCAGSAEIGALQMESGEGAVAAQCLQRAVPLAKRAAAGRQPERATARTEPVPIASVLLGVDVALE